MSTLCIATLCVPTDDFDINCCETTKFKTYIVVISDDILLSAFFLSRLKTLVKPPYVSTGCSHKLVWRNMLSHTARDNGRRLRLIDKRNRWKTSFAIIIAYSVPQRSNYALFSTKYTITLTNYFAFWTTIGYMLQLVSVNHREHQLLIRRNKLGLSLA